MSAFCTVRNGSYACALVYGHPGHHRGLKPSTGDREYTFKDRYSTVVPMAVVPLTEAPLTFAELDQSATVVEEVTVVEDSTGVEDITMAEEVTQDDAW